MPGTPTLTVLRASEAFSGVWDDLASRLELELFGTDDPAEAAAHPSVAVLLACGGVESKAVDILHAATRMGVELPLVVAADADHRLAVELMRRGAAAYYALPGDVRRLEDELLGRRDAWTRTGRASARGAGDRYDFTRIIGKHESITAALRMASKVIPSGRATVLLSGETGTGKELLARAIHDNGPRSARPFVPVNCSAIPANLLESELFGHERGAFTDARVAKPGLFEVADTGTLFLDEISAMPFELQGKLLRFLELGELRRVGAVKGKTVDVRVLAAANLNLMSLIERSRFREDLYYRLAVVRIELPPLRERGADRVLLARHFLGELAESYGYESSQLSPAATRAIERHSWPGNVRELRNAVERGLLFSSGATIRPEHLAIEMDRSAGSEGSDHRIGPGLRFPSTLGQLEKAAALAALDMCDGNKSEAARMLGITRSRLYRLLEKLR